MALPVFAGCGPTLAQLRLALPGAAPAVSSASANPGVLAQDPAFLNADQAQASIVGLWDIRFLAGDQVVDEGFDVWHSDGTETLNDTPPPVTGNICLGVWAQPGRNTFKLRHPSWVFDEATNTQVVGQATIRETVTVSRDGNSFSGNYTVDVTDTSGNLLQHFEGDVKATRIRPD